MRFLMVAGTFVGLMAAFGFIVPVRGDWVSASDPAAAVGPGTKCLRMLGIHTTDDTILIHLLPTPLENAPGWYRAESWMTLAWQPVEGDSIDVVAHDGPVIGFANDSVPTFGRTMRREYAGYWNGLVLHDGKIGIETTSCH